MIQPMMYFQLDNIPMFHGAYLITHVKHSIVPNSMTTNFTGVRVRHPETPILDAAELYMSLLENINITATNTTAVKNPGCANARKTVQSDTQFLAKVKEVATNIKAEFTELLGIMEIETFCSFSPAEPNGLGYYGLIQFGPETRASLFPSIASDSDRVRKLTSMSRVEQMEYVEKYFLDWKKINGIESQQLKAEDLYTLVFLPSLVEKPSTFVFAANGGPNQTRWNKNPALRDNTRPNKEIWKGYLGILVKASAIKYVGL
jgi:hypothetical protein